MIRVLLLSTDAATAEELAAWDWLARSPGIVAERADAAEPAAGGEYDVVWLHAGAPLDPSPALLTALRTRRPAGGWLLTGGAAALAAPLELGPEPHVRERVWRDQDDELLFDEYSTASPRLRGHAGFRDHPLFDGLHNGAFTWSPRAGERFVTATLDRATLPAGVQVLATERARSHVNAARATAWESAGPARLRYCAHAQPPGGGAPEPASAGPARLRYRGHALCLGAYLPFAPADPRYLPHVHRLAHNALRHAARGPAGAAECLRACWPTPGQCCVRADGLTLPHVGSDRPARISFATTPLRMAGGNTTDPFTLAGRRAFAVGTEGAGVDELWVHPLRALSALRLVGATPLAVEITALGIERALSVDGVTVDERVLVPHELGALVVEWDAADAVTLVLEWRTDLRLMWPYPAGALGDLHWRAADGTLLVRAAGACESGRAASGRPRFDAESLPRRAATGDAVCCHLSRPPLYWEVHGEDGAAPALLVRTAVSLRPGESLRLLVAASASGDDDLQATLAALRDPLSLGRARTAALRRLQHDRFSIRSPDARLDEAIEWAKYRLDTYLVATPGVGRSLVAGYGSSRPDPGSGRPGYAWYFGRDSAWTALASLAVGDFEAAADVIRFLGERQDLTGQVLHECTTSGLVHYDAADATPLYLLLVARYYAWTGQIGFVNGEWERVERALRFCLATDTDGDGLIGGGKVTYCNAGIWTAALRELAQLAQDMGAASLAAELYTRAGTAGRALEQRFFDPAAGRYALEAWQEESGHWRADLTPTAIHAVPLLLGVADPGRARSWLDDVASDEFSAEWGVRMVPCSHPLFDPRSRQGGAVRPLFTGWTAWAEYTAGRSEAAFRHLLTNACLAYERARGAWDDVLHGTERVSAGACPDQAWSTALTVTPLVYGMLGAEPDAARNRLRLRPQLPDGWDRFEARMLRLGDAAVSLRYERHHRHYVFRLAQERGATPVRVILEPVLPGNVLRHALVDGQPASLDARPFAGGRAGDSAAERSRPEAARPDQQAPPRMLVPVQLVLDAERVIEIHPE